MTTQLPTALVPASPWGVYDFRRLTAKSGAASGGVAQAELLQVPQDELWLLERAVVHCTSTATTAARLYLDTVAPTAMLDGSRSGNFDVADNGAPIQVPGGSVLICQWTGADDGAIGTLRVQVTVLKRR